MPRFTSILLVCRIRVDLLLLAMGVMLSVAFGVNILLTFLHVCNVTSVYVDLDHTTCTVSMDIDAIMKKTVFKFSKWQIKFSIDKCCKALSL